MEKWQLEKIAKKHGNQGSCSGAAVQKGDLGLPVQKYPVAENRCSLQSNRETVLK